MGAITIRRLDDAVIERIKRRARAANRSMEDEARRLLTNSVAGALSNEVFIERVRARRQAEFGDRVLPDSVSLIREIREEDPTVSPPDVGYP